MRPAVKFLLALLLLTANGLSAVYAQSASPPKEDAFTRENNAKRAQNPDGLLFTVRLKDNRKQFQQGEAVTLELSFAASKPNTFVLDGAIYDRSGRLDIDDFVLDRDDDVVDPLYDYFHSDVRGFVGGGLRSIPDLTDKPHIMTADLNEWMRFDKTGQYRLYVVSGRVTRKGAGSNYLSNNPLTAVSNVVEFEIVPADKKWADRELNQSVIELSKAGGDHRAACRTMRFLGTTAAVREMRKRFIGDDGDCEWECKFGLIGSPHRDLVIRDMETGISLPDQPVTSEFLNILALLEFTRQAPAPPPSPSNNEEQIKQWQEQMETRRGAYDGLRMNYLRQLMMAIPQKQGQARATSLETLLDHHSELNPRDLEQWPALLALMSEVFNRLPVDAQIRMLIYQWKPIASAAMLPVLRTILKDTANKPSSYQPSELRSAALRRIYELAPEEGRRLILDEIRRPNPGVNKAVLDSLPDELLPELDGVFATNLEESRGTGSGDFEVISELIQRYATAQVLPRVRAVFETNIGRWACRGQAALLAYVLRVDPSSGGEYLNKALAARGKGFSGCYTTTLENVARLHMSTEVQDAATAALDDDDVEVVSQAANVLKDYGSADAEKALWRRLEKWHEAMESRSEALRKQNPGLPAHTGNALSGQALIEQVLRSALARGRSWLADPEKLKRVRDLCLTDDGRGEVERMIRDWQYVIFVGLKSWDYDSSSMTIAHYSYNSLTALKEKLLQFPKGTVFKWSAAPNGNEDKAEEFFRQIKNHLEEHSMKLERFTEP